MSRTTAATLLLVLTVAELLNIVGTVFLGSGSPEFHTAYPAIAGPLALAAKGKGKDSDDSDGSDAPAPAPSRTRAAVDRDDAATTTLPSRHRRGDR